MSDLGIDPVDGDPPQIPQCPGTISAAVEEVEGPGIAEGELEIESGEVLAVDGLQADRQGDIAEPTTGGLGDETTVGLRSLAEVDERPVPFLLQPIEPGGRRQASAGELEVDGGEPGDAGRPSRRRGGIGGRLCRTGE